MYRFVVIVLLALVDGHVRAAALSDKNDGRIVGGTRSTINDRPYQVSLQSRAGRHFCGGSIITADTVLTAAHCMQSANAKEAMIRLGSTEHNKAGELVAIKTFRNHPNYNRATSENDVCVIKMASPVRQSSRVRIIPLARQTPPTGTPAVVSGWGVKCFLFCTKTQVALLEAEVLMVDRKLCSSAKYKYGDMVKKSMTCASRPGKDSCQGDSGGPLVAGGQLVGVVSFGIGCGKKDYPGVYADVAHLRGWILEATDAL